MMIIEEIEKEIIAMKELRDIESAKQKRAKQENVDKKYHALVEQAVAFSNALNYVQVNLYFVVSDDFRQKIVAFLIGLKNVVESGHADLEILLEAENIFNDIQEAMKKNWGEYFIEFTSPTTNTLKVISRIAKEEVKEYISNIKAAQSWSNNIKIFSNLKKALSKADSLIQSLNLNPNATLFLTKMASGQATINDIDEEVFKWIQNENLGEKIKLSF